MIQKHKTVKFKSLLLFDKNNTFINRGLVLGGKVPPPARIHCDFVGERRKRGKNHSTSVPNYWMGFYL